jgi:hypothetical protein
MDRMKYVAACMHWEKHMTTAIQLIPSVKADRQKAAPKA